MRTHDGMRVAPVVMGQHAAAPSAAHRSLGRQLVEESAQEGLEVLAVGAERGEESLLGLENVTLGSP